MDLDQQLRLHANFFHIKLGFGLGLSENDVDHILGIRTDLPLRSKYHHIFSKAVCDALANF